MLGNEALDCGEAFSIGAECLLAWARYGVHVGDLVVGEPKIALPAQVVCREDCAGLCPECGANLNEAGPDHRHEPAVDHRWDKLRELKFE